jgi:tetratricopeptide (TPR) repeat protein
MVRAQGHRFLSQHKAYSWKIALLLLVSILVYANSLPGEFVWDDTGFIVTNEKIKDLSNIPLFFKTSITTERETVEIRYRPLLKVSLAVDYALWGLNPAGYHATNILFHALTVLLIFLVAARLTGSEGVSFAAALVFAVHPVHVEAVSWIAARAHLMGAAFMLLSLYCYVVFRDREEYRWMYLSLASCLLAIFSIESAAVMPVILLCYEASFRRGKSWYLGVVPHFAAVAFYVMLRFAVVGCYPIEINTIPLASRFLTAPLIFVSYLYVFLFPPIVQVGYDVRPLESLSRCEAVLAATLMAVTVLLTLFALRNERPMGFFAFWFFATLAPLLGVVAQLFPMLMAARNLYIPSIGLTIVAVVLFARILSFVRAGVQRAVLVTVLVALSVFTVAENRTWQNNHVLFSKMVSEIPESSLAHYYLGHMYSDRGEHALAIEEYEQAVALRQEWHVLPVASEMYLDLANLYSLRGMTGKAITVTKEALKHTRDDYEVHFNLGVFYAKMGDEDRAIEEYMRAIKLRFNLPQAHFNLGNLFLTREEYRNAAQAYLVATRQNPGDLRAHYQLALAQFLAGDRMAAMRGLGHVRRQDPSLGYFLTTTFEQIMAADM